MSVRQSLVPVLIRLRRAIDQHVDAGDRDEFFDTVMTIAAAHDTHRGRGAGDAYLERVIGSLNGSLEDENED